MTLRLVIRPQAEADIDEAFRWYEERQAGLGAAFVAAVDACLTEIEQQPKIDPVLYRGTRRALLKRFPYGVFYVIQKDRIDAVACFHMRRNPLRWQTRVDER